MQPCSTDDDDEAERDALVLLQPILCLQPPPSIVFLHHHPDPCCSARFLVTVTSLEASLTLISTFTLFPQNLDYFFLKMHNLFVLSVALMLFLT